MKKFEKVYMKIIKESLNDSELTEAVYNIVDKAYLPPDVDKEQVKEEIIDLISGKDFENIGDLEQGVLDYIEKTYGTEEDYNDEHWVEHKLGMESKKVNKRRKIIKEDLDDTRKQQLEKIIEGCDQRFRSSKFVVHIGRGNGDYNSPLKIQLIHQGIPIPMVNYYQDCEGGSHIIPAPEIENLIRKVRRTLEENGIRFFDIEVS